MKKNITCLLIDDDPDDQEFFRTALKEIDNDYICLSSKNGSEAIASLKKDNSWQPDYIFIDLHMPFMDGRQCLMEIKKIKRLKKIPAFIYATSTDPVSTSSALELGALGIIIKASTIPDIRNSLKDIFNTVPILQLTDGIAKSIEHTRINDIIDLPGK